MSYIKYKNLLFFSLICGMVFFIPFLPASSNQINPQETEISVSVSPENPEPYQKVTVSLNSYSTDLNKAMITWQRGSSVVMAGNGKTSYSFDGTGPDTSIILDVKINTENLLIPLKKRIVVNFSEVILLWESVNSHTPPFYKGKSFVSKNGKVKAVAIPNTSIIKSRSDILTYTWIIDDEVDSDLSGFGKNSINLNNTYLNNREKIKVIASSTNSQYNASKEIIVPIVSPFVVFYKKSLLEGIFYNNGSRDEFFANKGENTIVVEPYFLEYKELENNFIHEWKVNGETIETPSKKTEITFRPTSLGGYADIEVYFQGIKNILQETRGVLRLNL